MAKKKHAEEHENLERWLVSYADFMTLLFATFVVLYALAQSDVSAFQNIADALNRAFNQNIFDNQASILEGSDSLLTGERGETTPIMLEYMSQKYEQSSYEDVKEGIEKLKENGVSADIDERGLVIRLNHNAVQYVAGSADLTPKSYEILSKVAKLIKEKFLIHYIQVEGHTDSDPVSSPKYPSNWELSSARASGVVRYFINNHNFNPKIFIATGLADTIPLAPNTTIANKAKNRRIEIIILKNKNKHLSKKNMQEILKETQMLQKRNIKQKPSQAIEKLIDGDRELLKNVVDMSDQYENESKRIETLDENDYMHDGNRPYFLEN